MTYLLIQLIVLATLLLTSLWHVGGRIAPRWRAGQQQRVALLLMSPRSPRMCNRLGLRLLPQMATACGTGCSQCGTCG